MTKAQYFQAQIVYIELSPTFITTKLECNSHADLFVVWIIGKVEFTGDVEAECPCRKHPSIIADCRRYSTHVHEPAVATSAENFSVNFFGMLRFLILRTFFKFG